VAEEPVSLRDLIETRFTAQGQLFEAKLALLEGRLTAADTARVLQAAEYERRLAALNHEHDTLATMSQTYVRDDIYVKDLDARKVEMEKNRQLIDEARQRQELNTSQNRRNTIGLIVAIVVAIIGWTIPLFLKIVH
jgi:hypothetical protein